TYSEALATYRRERLEKAKLPEGKSLAEWFRANETSLRKDPRQREANLAMAAVLLPLLEESPDRREAVGALNAIRGDASRLLRRLLPPGPGSAGHDGDDLRVPDEPDRGAYAGPGPALLPRTSAVGDRRRRGHRARGRLRPDQPPRRSVRDR